MESVSIKNIDTNEDSTPAIRTSNRDSILRRASTAPVLPDVLNQAIRNEVPPHALSNRHSSIDLA